MNTKQSKTPKIRMARSSQDLQALKNHFISALCILDQLPSDLLMEILSWLPIKSIFSCKQVCKCWLHLISHPGFAQLYVSRSPIHMLRQSRPYYIPTERLNLYHLQESVVAPCGAHKTTLLPKTNLPNCRFDLVNSCNGLLLLKGVDQYSKFIYICNPILGQYMTISLTSKGSNSDYFMGIGYCPLTQQYKVLRTYYPVIQGVENVSQSLQGEIYTIGTTTWRSLGSPPGARVTLPFNSFLTDSLHWTPDSPNNEEFIYSFNFESETFGTIPPPAYFGLFERRFSDDFKLGVYKGRLILSVHGDHYSNFEVWVMKEYGIRESWTKLFVIPNFYPCDIYELIIFLNDGKILMLYKSRQIAVYDPKTQNICRHEQRPFGFHAISFTPSFISLYNVGKGEQVER